MRRLLPLLLVVVLLPAIAQAKLGGNKSGGQQKAKQETSPTPAVAASQSKPEKKEADCGCEAKAPPDVFATVNGVNIAEKDVDESINDRIKELQSQVIEARKRQLDLEINSRLLEADAKRLGITPEK